MARDDVIRAAGVVTIRERAGVREVLIVHRALRDDWSLPKGKVDPGESDLEAAVRECDEESGVVPTLGCPLPQQSYRAMGQPKVVSYWRATDRRDEGFFRGDETDEREWIPVDEAKRRLTYPSDVTLVRAAAELPDTTPLVILRHAQAVKRAAFDGADDTDRPITGFGRSQARRLASMLDAFGIASVHSSPAVRCLSTVAPLATVVGTAVVREPALREPGDDASSLGTADRAAALAVDRRPLVLCTHRPTLPAVITAVTESLGIDPGNKAFARILDPRLTPAAFIVIHRAVDADGVMRAVDIERHSLDSD